MVVPEMRMERNKKVSNPNWKKLEQKIAKKLGGRRIPCSGVSRDFKGDVITDKLLIDCKYGEQIPKKLIDWWNKIEKEAKEMGKKPALVLKKKSMRGELIVLKLDDEVIRWIG